MSFLPTTSSPSVSAWQVITHFICFPSSAPSVSISSVFCRFIISVWTENKEMELLSWVMTSGIWGCESENWTAERPHLQTPCLLGRQRLCQTDLRAHPLNNLISFPFSISSVLSSLTCTVWQHGNEGLFFLLLAPESFTTMSTFPPSYMSKPSGSGFLLVQGPDELEGSWQEGICPRLRERSKNEINKLRVGQKWKQWTNENKWQEYGEIGNVDMETCGCLLIILSPLQFLLEVIIHVSFPSAQDGETRNN